MLKLRKGAAILALVRKSAIATLAETRDRDGLA